MIRRVLSAVALLATRRLYSTVSIGAGSRVDFWRVKAKSQNCIRIGSQSLLASRVVYEQPGASLTVGTRSFVGLGLMSIAERVDIGDDVMVSWGATIIDHNSHSLLARERAKDVEQWLQGRKDWTGIKIAPVKIENRAWLGFNVAILPGAVVGEGAIVAACSVVTGSVPAWTIAAGNPARVVRELTAAERT
jgi:acetyltransferase-like isoleucine patch superfamily enzyme